MKHIYLNLKRFDVPVELGGVNRIAPVADWAEYVVKNTQEELKKYDSNELYVIGGGSIYEMLIPYCDTAYITKIDHAYAADTYFPNLDQMDDWEMTEVSEEQTCFDLEYVFAKYERK